MLSCNPETDKWAKENIEYYQSASRDELVELSLSKLRALYRGFSKEKIDSLWSWKYSYECKHYALSAEESSFYKTLIDYQYVGKTEYQAFSDWWLKTANEKYHWPQEMVFVLGYTWLTEDEYIAASILELAQNTKFDIGDNIVQKADCECNTDWGCIGLGFDCNVELACNVTEVGCGLMQMDSCAGLCYKR